MGKPLKDKRGLSYVDESATLSSSKITFVKASFIVGFVQEAGTQKNWVKSLFPNDGSGKTLRKRDILFYFCNHQNCTINLFVPGARPRYIKVYNSKVWIHVRHPIAIRTWYI